MTMSRESRAGAAREWSCFVRSFTDKMLLAAESICLGQQASFTGFDFKPHDAPSPRRHEGYPAPVRIAPRRDKQGHSAQNARCAATALGAQRATQPRTHRSVSAKTT